MGEKSTILHSRTPPAKQEHYVRQKHKTIAQRNRQN